MDRTVCGIAGVMYRDGRRAREDVLVAMADTLAHRGPDGSGTRSFEGGGLAHRRLSIVDLSNAAAQPLSSHDDAVTVVFNGEIYNFRELREQLQSQGHSFRSSGDTEVVLKHYLQHGAGSIASLDGMFAIAIWDSRTRTLLLARDRTGKKPLYVYEDAEKLVFASEIKAILAHPDIDDALAPDGIPLFLTYGYVPTPGTQYARIRKLEAGTYQLIASNLQPRTTRYWDFATRTIRGVTPGEAREHVRDLFFRAVQRRLVADVPLGAFLSGGIDSTLVVGAMTRLSSSRVRTFSIGFEGQPDYDETHFARLVARRFDTEHTEFKVRAESFDLLEKLAWHHDEPFGDASSIPTYIVSSLTRRHVSVALTGDGGDEVFAGYPRFIAASVVERAPAPLRRSLHMLLRHAPRRWDHRGLAGRALRFARNATRPLADRVRGWLTFFTPEEIADLLDPEVLAACRPGSLSESYERALPAEGTDAINRLLVLNARTYLLDDLNPKVDRMAMAASLETRSPFLDTALMDYAFSLPGAFKARGQNLKWILKEAFPDLLPREVVHRTKMGFGVPLGAWFRGELRSYLEERLLDRGTGLDGVVRRSTLEAWVRDHQAGRRDRGLQLWSLCMLEIFLRARRHHRRAAGTG